MKTLHLSLIIGIAGMTAICVASFTMIDLQSKNSESDKYVFEGNYEISKDMTGSVGGKSFFVSQTYPENYVNDSIMFHGVIFSTPDRNNDTNPSGFVSNLVRFYDGINETLTTGYGGHPPNTITILTKHQNPQAGLTRYSNGSINFLVNTVAIDLGTTDSDLLHTTIDNPETISSLENDVGTITFGNQVYYFETPNYTHDAYFNPVQISFHDVIFTLFPSGFRGGLPVNGCGGQYYWTDAKFSDGTSDLLHIFVGSPQCSASQPPTYFSTHTNPQGGLTFYDGKMKLLVSVENK